MSNEPVKAADGIAYIRCLCTKCGEWAPMEMPENNAWDRRIAHLEKVARVEAVDAEIVMRSVSEMNNEVILLSKEVLRLQAEIAGMRDGVTRLRSVVTNNDASGRWPKPEATT